MKKYIEDFIREMINRNYSRNTIKGLLGHKSIKTTMVYLSLADPISRRIKSPL